METTEIILWVMGAGFSVLFALLLIIWNALKASEISLLERIRTSEMELFARMDNLDARMDRFESRMDKFDEKLTDIDRRLCRMEGALTAKDCCMLKDDRANLKGTG